MNAEDQQHIIVQAWGDREGGEIELSCTRCGWDEWIDKPVTLAELNRRAAGHVEECQ